MLKRRISISWSIILQIFVYFHIDIFNKNETKFLQNTPWNSPLKESAFQSIYPFSSCKNITEKFHCVVVSTKIYRFRKDVNMWQYVILYCNNLIIYVTKRHTRLLCGRWFAMWWWCKHFHLSSMPIIATTIENNRCVKRKEASSFNWLLSLFKMDDVITFNWSFTSFEFSSMPNFTCAQ